MANTITIPLGVSRTPPGSSESGCSVVVPNWNGRVWLDVCLRSLAAQTSPPREVVVIDNGSTDGSVAHLRQAHPQVRVVALAANTGFAHAANVGLHCTDGEYVAFVNTDVELAPGWLQHTSQALANHPRAASVACKMVELSRPDRIYDAGDILRRDGACEQRGRFEPDDGRWDDPGVIFGACAGAALYRRAALIEVGGFDERYFAYLEDVDLALRLRLRGWDCRYEPVVARHAGEGSSHQLPGGHLPLVARNTLVLVAKAFPLRWLPLVAYRQLGWAWHAHRNRRLCAHLGGVAAALPMLPSALRERRRLRASARIDVAAAVPHRPIRGPRAGGHRSRHADRGPA
ncbi:MAG: glycosyltransferase family 2 protein [Solirubrobacteraceae bacterium]